MYEQYIPAPAPSKTEFNLFNSEMTKVIIGNTSTDNVATGEYVSLKKSIISGLSDGIYKSKSNIASGTPFVSSNLEAVTGGAVNALNDGLDALNGKISALKPTSPLSHAYVAPNGSANHTFTENCLFIAFMIADTGNRSNVYAFVIGTHSNGTITWLGDYVNASSSTNGSTITIKDDNGQYGAFITMLKFPI